MKAEGVAVSPGWLSCGVSYASSWSSVSFLLSRSVPFSGARQSCHRFQAMLVCYGLSPAGARARRSVAGVVNHRCYFWWRRVRVPWCVAALVAPFPNKYCLYLSGCLGLGRRRRRRSVKAASQDAFIPSFESVPTSLDGVCG
ncbi:hypothetical protein F2Q68_00014530 [Brassica cretica]|uniref:Secreted protein n=3 Tax=Brassica cretica TaxID=69181 RepID=A0ABQ7F810_BRACR|nr:hypothetical protein F2Q68_00014530 [Brassica cretica]KAF3612216.1 hypothetical protein DY000_02047034 [Brassica cretica]